MTLVEWHCPECGNVIDAPTDARLKDADNIVAKEADDPCGACQEPTDVRSTPL